MTTRTPAQLSLIHTAESAGISAFMTLIGGVYQYTFTNGLNIPGLAGFLGTSFVACMLMMYKSVKSNPQLAQAAIDTSSEVKASLDTLATAVSSHVGILQEIRRALATPPTVIGQPAPQPPAIGNLFPVTSNASPVTPGTATSTAIVSTPFAPSPLPPQQQFPSRFTADVPAMPPRG